MTFGKSVIKRTCKTFCSGCGKKLTRVVSDQYYRNGLHDEATTRAKMNTDVEKRASELRSAGTHCKACAEKFTPENRLKELTRKHNVKLDLFEKYVALSYLKNDERCRTRYYVHCKWFKCVAGKGLVATPAARACAKKMEALGLAKPGERPKLWQTIVRIVGVSDNRVMMVVPGWDSEKQVSVWIESFKKSLRKHVVKGNRFFAHANLGAEDEYEMESSLGDFQFRGKSDGKAQDGDGGVAAQGSRVDDGQNQGGR